MNPDLERDLRETLSERHAAARTSPLAPPEVLHRARRREVGTVLFAAATALVLIAGAVGGIQAVLRHEPEQTIGDEGSPLPTEGPGPGQDSLLLDGGEIDGEPWELRVTQDERGVSLEFGYVQMGSGGGGLSPMTGRHVFLSYGGSPMPEYPNRDTSRPPLPIGLSGEVLAAAARVEYLLEHGPTVDARLYDLPPSLVGPAKVFLLLVPGDTLLLAGELVAYDAAGNELGREYLDMSPVSLFPKVLDESPPNAVAAMKDLQLAGAVVGRFYAEHGSFSGLDPETASAIWSEVPFNTSSTAVPGEVSIRVTGPQDLVLATATDDGAIYSACLVGGPSAAMYGRNDTGDPQACTNGWLDPSASPPPPSGNPLIASGADANGNLWSLQLLDVGQDFELEYDLGAIQASMPLEPLGNADLGSIATTLPTEAPQGVPPMPGAPTSIWGVASDGVSAIQLETDDGRTFEGTLYAIPPGSIDAPQAFLILAPINEFIGTVVAFDADGNELQREDVSTPPSG
jgi:hypothetical protein